MGLHIPPELCNYWTHSYKGARPHSPEGVWNWARSTGHTLKLGACLQGTQGINAVDSSFL